MIKDEEYIAFLKSIISCISHGDYYSVKELSNLELERVNKKIDPKFCELLYKSSQNLGSIFLFILSNSKLDNSFTE